MALSDEETWIWRRSGKTDEVTKELLFVCLAGLQFICHRFNFCSVACLLIYTSLPQNCLWWCEKAYNRRLLVATRPEHLDPLVSWKGRDGV